MNLQDAQRQIDSLRNALERAKSSTELPFDAPALVGLEQILFRKIEELESAKKETGFNNLLFADIEDDKQVGPTIRGERYR